MPIYIDSKEKLEKIFDECERETGSRNPLIQIANIHRNLATVWLEKEEYGYDEFGDNIGGCHFFEEVVMPLSLLRKLDYCFVCNPEIIPNMELEYDDQYPNL